MKPPNHLTDSILDDLVKEALARCSKAPVHNFVLKRKISVASIHKSGPEYLEKKAVEWQSKDKPPNLCFNHGMYIHSNGDGVGHIIRELKTKRDSNRALYSLINMDQVFGSGDKPIPGFMVLQCGIIASTLFCTVYFRALEIKHFLPINITEICIVLRKITSAFSEIKSVELYIHAFRAYVIEVFDCLEIPELDLLGPGKISAILSSRDNDHLRRLLIGKRNEYSVIQTNGIQEICNFLHDSGGGLKSVYSSRFINAMRKAHDCLIELKEERTRASHSSHVKKLGERFRKHLDDAIKYL